MRPNVPPTVSGSDFRYAEADDASLAHDLEMVAKKIADVTRKATRELDAVSAADSGAQERRTREAAEKIAAARDPVAQWTERSEGRLSGTGRLASDAQDRTAGMLTDALAAVTRRLDEIERKITEPQQPSMEAATTGVGRIEAQMTSLGQEGRGNAHNAQIEAALRGVEERIAQVSDRIAHGLPRGSRVQADPRAGLTSAIEEIRFRQSELEEAPSAAGRASRDPVLRSQTELLRSLRDDFSRLAGQLDTSRARAEGDETVNGLHADITALRHSLGELATRQEVGALEHTIRDLGQRIDRAWSDERDLTCIVQPLAVIEAEVRRLSETVGTEAKTRASVDLQGLARKLDTLLEKDVTPAILERLSGELGDIRALMRDLVDPQRVRTLAEQVAGLNHQVAQVRRQFGSADFSSLTSTIDEIRTAVRSRPPANGQSADTLAREIEGLSARIDGALATGGSSGEVAMQLERLTGRIDGALAAAGTPKGLELLAERIDRLNDNLGRSPRESELKPIEDMLRGLAEKLDRAGGRGGDLEGLERQIAHLAERVERSSGQPAFASLERAMGDLLAQMQALRSETAEAAERAVRSTIIHTLQSLPKSLDPEFAELQEGLAELKASQGESGQWTQDTFAAVHTTLDKVVARLAALDREVAVDRPAQPPSALDRDEPVALPKATPFPSDRNIGADRADMTTSSTRPMGKAAEARPSGKQVEDSLRKLEAELVPHLGAKAGEHARRLEETEEILLEPGEARPKREPLPAMAPLGADAHDVKASFIAAARRAAQAAASEASSGKERPSGARHSRAVRYGDLGRDGGSLAKRAKRNLDERRRPILLGLAAIVLALGALQVVGTMHREQTKPVTVAAPRVETKVALAPLPAPPRDIAPPTTGAIEAPEARAMGAATPASQGENASPASLADIAARERDAALAEAAKAKMDGAAAVQQSLERIANIAALGIIPANAGPAALRQAALAGEPAAVYEFAARAAEGRGMARDLALAAKLFEKAAVHGLVPAQYRTGNVYEKGLGVPRDLAVARSWYQRAADKGNARAMHNLAVLIAEGVGGQPDYAAAIGWFRRAAQHGVRDSQFNLAVLLARGLGAQQDLAGAYTWFAIVATGGDEDAAKKRDEVGARLGAPELAAARQAAERWRPETPDKFANEVMQPAQGWTEAPAAKQRSNGRV
jgi:localization factor PodJL